MQHHRLYMTYNESNMSKMPRELVRGAMTAAVATRTGTFTYKTGTLLGTVKRIPETPSDGRV